MAGDVALSLRFEGEQTSLNAECVFDEARIEVDVFDLVANLAAGRPAAEGDGAAREIDLDVNVGFALRRIGVEVVAGGEAPVRRCSSDYRYRSAPSASMATSTSRTTS